MVVFLTKVSQQHLENSYEPLLVEFSRHPGMVNIFYKGTIQYVKIGHLKENLTMDMKLLGHYSILSLKNKRECHLE